MSQPWIAFGSSLGGAALGAFLGWGSSYFALRKQRRQDRAQKLRDLAQSIHAQTRICKTLKEEGEPTGGPIRELQTSDFAAQSQLQVIAADHPKWNLVGFYAQRIQLAQTIAEWNHGQDPDGKAISQALHELLTIADTIAIAELGRNKGRSARERLRTDGPLP